MSRERIKGINYQLIYISKCKTSIVYRFIMVPEIKEAPVVANKIHEAPKHKYLVGTLNLNEMT